MLERAFGESPEGADPLADRENPLYGTEILFFAQKMILLPSLEVEPEQI